jgi:hypothetical protein
MKILKIKWIDSKAAPNEWEYRDDIDPLEPTVCTSIGFLVEETPTYKTLAHSVSDNQICGRITIPVSSIQKCKQLK